MHAPPPARYEVERSRLLGGTLVLLWLLGTLNLTFFAWMQLQLPVAAGLVLLALLAGLWAFRGWFRMSTGTLRWDGEQLLWQHFQTPVQSLHILLDMDFLLLLRMSAQGQSDYIVLTRTTDPHWSAIRRALVAFDPRIPEAPPV